MNETQQVSPSDPVSFRMRGSRTLARVLMVCFAIELGFFVCDATLNHADWLPYSSLQRFFNTTREDALPSFFGVTQTAGVGLIVWLLAWAESARGSARRVVIGWSLVACFFTYLAIDDGAMLHERVGSALEDAMAGEDERLSFFPSYEWQVVFVPAFALMGIAIFAFASRQFRSWRQRLAMLGAFGIMGAAVALDFVEGLSEDHAWNIYAALGSMDGLDDLADRWFDQDGYDAILHFSKSVEEVLEMMSMSILGWVFARQVLYVAPRQLWLLDDEEASSSSPS